MARATAARARRRPWLRRLLILIAVGALLAGAAAWLAYERIGRTPGELMDYAERRLQGHNKLEFVALPVLTLVRDWLDEPRRAERDAQPWLVPPPPDLPLAPAPPIPAEARAGKVWRVGPQGEVPTIASVARLARHGDIVEIQAGVYRGDVTVWPQRALTIRAVGGRVRLVADGRAAEGKAIWVIRNGEFTISGIDFVGGRVPDRNGAGIRFEGGRLRVFDCLFWDNENGILTIGQQPHAELEVHGSEFGYNGAGDGQSHHIYAGRLARLHVRGSYFHHAYVGHLLKSRAQRSEVLYNRLSDEAGGRASYEMDFPNGGDVLVMGNVVQQSRSTENSHLVRYGAEGLAHRRNLLVLASNTLVNEHPYGGTMLRVADGTQQVVAVNNLLAGPGRFVIAEQVPSVLANNPRADWSAFARAARQDYRVADGSGLAYEAPADAGYRPDAEYQHPRQVRALGGAPVVAGALQTPP